VILEFGTNVLEEVAAASTYFYPEDVGSTFLRNVGSGLQYRMSPEHRKSLSKLSGPSKPQMA
jgi:hypothetical protein